VLHLDTVYDPSETFDLLHIDPSPYSLDHMMRPFIQEALRMGEKADQAGALV